MSGLQAVNVAAPGDGSTVIVENEDGDSIYGGKLWVRNSGTVDLLLGGNDKVCVWPLKTTDPWLPLDLDGTDQLYHKISTGAVAGQLSVLKAEK